MLSEPSALRPYFLHIRRYMRNSAPAYFSNNVSTSANFCGFFCIYTSQTRSWIIERTSGSVPPSSLASATMALPRASASSPELTANTSATAWAAWPSARCLRFRSLSRFFNFFSLWRRFGSAPTSALASASPSSSSSPPPPLPGPAPGASLNSTAGAGPAASALLRRLCLPGCTSSCCVRLRSSPVRRLFLRKPPGSNVGSAATPETCAADDSSWAAATASPRWPSQSALSSPTMPLAILATATPSMSTSSRLRRRRLSR
mmetsp:Transcript_26054/g.65646  ORF Transcript_26054/g.65646 Transcript_26054/m.65646 type:complete len:260 (+) Transcript_26054:406-1185(+)